MSYNKLNMDFINIPGYTHKGNINFVRKVSSPCLKESAINFTFQTSSYFDNIFFP